METCPPIVVLNANIPTGRDDRPRTACPKFPENETKSHCHCSASEHICGFCDEKW